MYRRMLNFTRGRQSKQQQDQDAGSRGSSTEREPQKSAIARFSSRGKAKKSTTSTATSPTTTSQQGKQISGRHPDDRSKNLSGSESPSAKRHAGMLDNGKGGATSSPVVTPTLTLRPHSMPPSTNSEVSGTPQAPLGLSPDTPPVGGGRSHPLWYEGGRNTPTFGTPNRREARHSAHYSHKDYR